jgi:hypothetical protein
MDRSGPYLSLSTSSSIFRFDEIMQIMATIKTTTIPPAAHVSILFPLAFDGAVEDILTTIIQ